MKIPERTCISCRKKYSKDQLLRIVSTKDTIIPDKSGKVPGRGAYVCKNKKCIDKISLKSLNHAFKTNTEKNYKTFIELLRNDDMAL